MYAQRPQWLESVFRESHPPPKLFAWSASNLSLVGEWKPCVADDLDRRIFILGIGNLGRLFASCLAQAPDSPPITLVVHRKELLTQWDASQGIEILRSGVLEKNKNFNIEWWTDSPPDHGVVREVADGMKLKNLLVTTKATAALPQVDRLRGYLDHNSTVVFAQNGMSKLWPPHGHTYTSYRYSAGDVPNFLACVTTHGVTSQGPFKSLHASQADVAIGTVLPNQSSSEAAGYFVNQILEAPRLNGRPVSRAEFWILQLEKLVVNSVINPLTAILGCKNGALFTGSDEVLAGVIDQLVGEASQVLQLLVNHESSAEIIRDVPASQYPESSLDLSPQSLCDRFSQPRLKDMVYRVGDKVRENTSSMRQDFRTGRSTEIRDFNGWLVETAAFLDPSLDLTGHSALVDLVEAGNILPVDRLGSHFDKSGAPSS
ncbi:ketopantoate reductase PanE/ApbA C terminal-domain-containing protein [Dactylonectria macrodidyma]|uniref:Ketopantoate reductase PanE/ApbA C terminal-domain-containing protein n=1 Tax=Dactylonectria macrodidyma TaxID=307937 RepID=A0A9P9IYM2_9HYPO|nr:ketopantoate reductase PanE/ApbA C terminal-domain-containing protein [Dactylonectria macrodidyma]